MPHKAPRISYALKNEKDLACLSPVERIVIQMRLGLGKFKKKHMLKEAGEYLKLGCYACGKARNIETRAIKKLHKSGNLIFL